MAPLIILDQPSPICDVCYKDDANPENYQKTIIFGVSIVIINKNQVSTAFISGSPKYAQKAICKYDFRVVSSACYRLQFLFAKVL